MSFDDQTSNVAPSAQGTAGTKSRNDANKQYLAQSNIVNVLNDMVEMLVCCKPQDELEALIYFLEQRQQQEQRGGKVSDAVVSRSLDAAQQPQNQEQQSFSPSPPKSQNATTTVNPRFQHKKPNQQQQQAEEPTEQKKEVAIPEKQESSNAATNDGEVVVDLVQQFCANDDLLFQRLFGSASISNFQQLTRFISQNKNANPEFVSFCASSLENNERMLKSALLLAATESSIDFALVSFKKDDGKKIVQPSKNKTEQVLLNIERRIARTTALRRVLVISDSNESGEVTESSKRLEKTIFFSSATNQQQLSSSTEIEMLLNEFIANAQMAVKVLEESQNLTISDRKITTTTEKEEGNNQQQQQQQQQQQPAAETAKWIQESLRSIEVATKLRDEHRRVFLLNNPVSIIPNKGDSASFSSSLSEISPSALGINDYQENLVAVRAFVNEGRKFIVKWLQSKGEL